MFVTNLVEKATFHLLVEDGKRKATARAEAEDRERQVADRKAAQTAKIHSDK